MEEILSPEQWDVLQRRLKIKFPELTDDDMQYHESLEKDLLRMVGYSIKRDIVHMQGLFSAPVPVFVNDTYPLNGVNHLFGQKVKLKHKIIV
jgi:hypothetical protein